MTSLFKRSALASALLLTAMGAQAASMDFETSDSDTIVIGATTEKVTIRIVGYKNLQPRPSGTNDKLILGNFRASTSSGVGHLAVTYAPEHNPKVEQTFLTGLINNSDGNEIKTKLIGRNINGTPIAEVNGTPWFYNSLDSYTEFYGDILTLGENTLSAGVYPITLRAALYQP